MTLTGIAARNLRRNKLRSVLTVLGVAVAVMAFVLLRTVLVSWNSSIEQAAKDRLGTRHKVSFILELPKRYVDAIREQKGVKAATWANWFGGKDPRHPDEFFMTLAVDPQSYLDVYDEMSVKPEARERWLNDRQGVLVGDHLASKLGLKVGDRLSLESNIYRGTFTFNVSGIFTSESPTIDRTSLLFQWKYFDESRPAVLQDKVGWIVSRIDDPSQTGQISAAIDRVFDEQDVQTLTMSEKAMSNSFMGMFTAILKAVQIVSLIILLILLLILGNTVAMGVRERRHEYGVLRALGFLPRHIAGFVIGESVLLGLIAGLVGVGVAYPLVQYGLGRWIEENMNSMFSWFQVTPQVVLLSLLLSALLGVLAGVIPAWRAARLTVVDALRRID
jgi:putative ABC transport system permease protein